ncbi:isochorismatase family protein [Nitzschia inconspicua]|uniref:Isochorismatase family protein n=1 Tax=Nitzschia inconspicua TaxID=303405 RepID=A0A9K3KGS3_9STRA|nr:isochorismatase family protein [Nitzschia inconspicua]
MSSSSECVTTLLLVDIQNDFHPGGSLAIPTANEDSHRVAQLIRDHSSKITRVVATMDSHVKLHIAHPGFWISGQQQQQLDDGPNKHPEPFTVIESKDIINGIWKPRSDLKILPDTIEEDVFGMPLQEFTQDDGSLDLYKYAIEYTKRLEDKGKFKLIVWPEHCLIGSKGFCMVDEVHDALQEWSMTTGGTIEWVLKGENLLTESYSALEAEVPINGKTSLNQKLLDSLKSSDRLLVCGQAMSHCVNYTLSSIVEQWDRNKLSNITLLTDCASSVPGFEAAGAKFQQDMSQLGVILQKSSEAFEY